MILGFLLSNALEHWSTIVNPARPFPKVFMRSRSHRIPGALAAGTDQRVRRWEAAGLLSLLLLYLGDSIDYSARRSDCNRRDTGQGDRSIEEDKSADGDWDLVERTDHRIRCTGCGPDAPGRGVGDSYGTQTRYDHCKYDSISGLGREIAVQILG